MPSLPTSTTTTIEPTATTITVPTTTAGVDLEPLEGLEMVGPTQVVGPRWTWDKSMEKPAGTKNMGTWVASVYTPEQQERLSVDETGQPRSQPAVQGGLAKNTRGTRAYSTFYRLTPERESARATAFLVEFDVNITKGVQKTFPRYPPLQWVFLHYRYKDSMDVTKTTERMKAGNSLEYPARRYEVWRYLPLVVPDKKREQLEISFTVKPGDGTPAFETEWQEPFDPKPPATASSLTAPSETSSSTTSSTPSTPSTSNSATSNSATSSNKLSDSSTQQPPFQGQSKEIGSHTHSHDIAVSQPNYDNNAGVDSTHTALKPYEKNPLTRQWIGSYEPDDTCQPGPECCCAKTRINVTPVYPDATLASFPTGTLGSVGPNTVYVTGETNGGKYDACLGQSSLHALMNVDETGNTATLTITAGNGVSKSSAVATLVPIEKDGKVVAHSVTLVSSLYKDCPSVAIRSLPKDSVPTANKGVEPRPRLPATTNARRFNCFTKEKWHSEKIAWCCRAQGIGCRQRGSETEDKLAMQSEVDRAYEKQQQQEEDKSAGVATAIVLSGGVKDRIEEMEQKGEFPFTKLSNGKRPVFSFPPSTPSSPSTPPSNTPSPTREPDSKKFLGSYQWDEDGCDPTKCCCGAGMLFISQGKNASDVRLESAVAGKSKEGRDLCRGQKQLVANFVVNHPTIAEFALEKPLAVAIKLESNASDPDKLTLSSRIQDDPVCTMQASRLAPSVKLTTPSPTKRMIDVVVAVPQTHDHDTVSITDIQAFVGHWQVAPGCVPSKDCCCGKDRMIVEASSAEAMEAHKHGHDHDHSSMSLISVRTAVDGGKGCYNIKSLHGPCKVTGKSVGVCEIKVPGVETSTPPLVFLHMSKNGTKLSLNSTLYGAGSCPATIAVKVPPGEQKKASCSLLVPSLSAILVAMM